MLELKVDIFDEASINAAITKLDMWSKGSFEPATDYYVGLLAEEAKKVMYADAHGPEDNGANTGGLKRQILAAPVDIFNGTATITIQSAPEGDVRFDETNPREELYWPKTEYHGNTPPPHDFTRNLKDEIGENAKQIWDMNVRGLL